jgi:hypothetical protein
MFGIVVDEEAMSNSTSTVVATPDDWSGGIEDLLESFDDELADSTFVVGWR